MNSCSMAEDVAALPKVTFSLLPIFLKWTTPQVVGSQQSGKASGVTPPPSHRRGTIQKYESGHRTSGVCYTQPHYLSEIRTQPVEKGTVEFLPQLMLFALSLCSEASPQESARPRACFLMRIRYTLEKIGMGLSIC